jgi:conjugal transfer pilus assembly protein TraD
MPWRPAYEFWSAIAWSSSAILMLAISFIGNLPKYPMWYMATISALMAGITWRETIVLWTFKISLAGRPFSFINPKSILEKMKKNSDMLWLGYGFDWTNKHTQRVIEARKMDTQEMLPPEWFLKAKGIPVGKRNAVGAAWIHGVEPNEKNIYIPLSAMEGHTLVFGTTGAGKTRLYETLIFQSIMRGDVVFIIDPKGDKELKDIAKRACIQAGRKDAFLFFHPAFPSDCVRLDPLKNWNRETEPASRIAGLLPSDGGGDTFIQFSWRVVNLITQGLIYIEDRPNLQKLRRYIEGGPDGVMEAVLKTFFQRNVESWEIALAQHRQLARDGKIPNKIGPTASPDMLAFMSYYKKEVPVEARNPVVDGLMSITEHSREHMSKMITSLVPLLTMLTSGDLGALLSPDTMDIDDQRPIYDTSKIITGNHVIYIGLDSLSDPTVGSAIASMILAELASVAGARYNYGTEDGKKIKVFVDEAAECVNQPLIQILNKGRGAAFEVTLAAQTLPDFIVKMGSEPKARQILGNCNNLIALRTKDRVTQDFIVETFGETHIQKLTTSHSSSTKSDDGGMHVGGGISEGLSEEKISVFPPELLGMLPNLQFMASMAGGRLIKGRLPKITEHLIK